MEDAAIVIYRLFLFKLLDNLIINLVKLTFRTDLASRNILKQYTFQAQNN